jgi:hypothetical protein
MCKSLWGTVWLKAQASPSPPPKKTGITLAISSTSKEHLKLVFQITAQYVHEQTSQKPKHLCLF